MIVFHFIKKSIDPTQKCQSEKQKLKAIFRFNDDKKYITDSQGVPDRLEPKYCWIQFSLQASSGVSRVDL